MLLKPLIISALSWALASGNPDDVTHMKYGKLAVDGPMRSILLYVNAFTDFTLVSKARDDSQAYFTSRNKSGEATTAEDMMVYATSKTATVWNISVYYPVQDDTWSMESQFIELVASLTESFGEPAELKINDNGRHQAWFENEEGAVAVDITNDNQTCIEYYDSANVDLYFEELKD